VSLHCHYCDSHPSPNLTHTALILSLSNLPLCHCVILVQCRSHSVCFQETTNTNYYQFIYVYLKNKVKNKFFFLLLLLLPFTRPSLRIEHYWQGSDRIHCACWFLYVSTIL
jgi:hypothetical protein